MGLLSTEKLGRSIGEWTELVDACLKKEGYEVRDAESREKALSTLLESQDPSLVKDVLNTLKE